MGNAGRKQDAEAERLRRSSDLVRVILEELARRWPDSIDLDPAAAGLADEGRNQEFARIVQALLDQGFITYESARRSAGGPRFVNAHITPSGRTALNVMRFLARLS